MKMRNIFKLILMLFVCILNINLASAQQTNRVSINQLNRKTATIFIDGSIVDTLVAYGLGNKHTFLKVDKEQNKIYVSNHIVPGLGSFSNAYISLEIWQVVKNELKSNKLKLKLNNQKAKNVRLNFLSEGVNIILRKSVFKNETYFIPYENFEKLESFTLP